MEHFIPIILWHTRLNILSSPSPLLWVWTTGTQGSPLH